MKNYQMRKTKKRIEYFNKKWDRKLRGRKSKIY